MGLLEKLMCRMGKHYRSRGYARKDELGWRSRCVYCGTPMRKLSDGKWIAEPPLDDAPEGEELDDDLLSGEEALAGDPLPIAEPGAKPGRSAPRRRGLFRRKARG